MDKKKKLPDQEREARTPEKAAEKPEETTGKDAPEMETEGELQESITLSREEFGEVKAHIEKLQKEKDDTVALAQRLQADFDNFRKRNASIHAESRDEGARELMRDVLPVLDNFERALDKADDVDKAWADGVRLVDKQLVDALKKKGLEEIPTEGKFDPERHEAVMQDEAEGAESGTITAVLLKGYRVNDRIIRHSMVKVAK